MLVLTSCSIFYSQNLLYFIMATIKFTPIRNYTIRSSAACCICKQVSCLDPLMVSGIHGRTMGQHLPCRCRFHRCCLYLFLKEIIQEVYLNHGGIMTTCPGCGLYIMENEIQHFNMLYYLDLVSNFSMLSMFKCFCLILLTVISRHNTDLQS